MPFLNLFMPLKNLMLRFVHYVSMAFFSKFKTEFYCISFFLSPDCLFENSPAVTIRCRVYSNCCCSCSFEAEIIKIGQSSHKMYSNNILNVQESTTILNVCTKKSLETYWRHHVDVFKNYLYLIGTMYNKKYLFFYFTPKKCIYECLLNTFP